MITSKPTDYNYLKKEFKISFEDFKKIKDDHEIIEELKLATKDSLTKKRASSILDSFLSKENKSKKKLLAILELNRIFKGSNYKIINNKDIDTSKALIINDLNELKKIKDNIKNIKVKTKTDTTKIKNH